MTAKDKVLKKVLSGRSDANISFAELCHLLRALGFAERIEGSHHLFEKPGIFEMINLQSDQKHAKPYQVRQVRTILMKSGVGGDDEDA